MPESTPATEEGLSCTLQALFVHPIKSCAGIACDASLLTETGLELDRAFMVTDDEGGMLTQRSLPRMALIRPTLRSEEMLLRAPGMLTLHVRLDTVEAPTQARVWRDTVAAFDMGPLAAQWFSDFLGRSARLVRFDPAQRRLSDAAWTGAVEAENAFADGFPVLVANAASLDDLNLRLAARGAAPVDIRRFRPNLVVAGLAAYDEDHIDTIEVDTPDGPVRLRLVKPCVRCSIPNVDPETAEAGTEPGATLAGYRTDPRMQGGVTFAMNAVVLDGFERCLRVGQSARASLAFE